MKNTICKWLLTLDDMGLFVIEQKEVSKYAPINRILDEVGYYELDSIKINQTIYMIVYKPEERYTKKSMILVSKIRKGEKDQWLTDMIEEDLKNVENVAKLFLIQETQIVM